MNIAYFEAFRGREKLVLFFGDIKCIFVSNNFIYHTYDL